MSKFSGCANIHVTFRYVITFILITLFINVFYRNGKSNCTDVCCSNKITTNFQRLLQIFCFSLFLKKKGKLFRFEHFEVLTVSLMMKDMASTTSRLSVNEAFTSTMIIIFLFIFDFSSLIFDKVIFVRHAISQWVVEI